MHDGYTTIAELARESGVNADSLRLTLATTPRRQEYGQVLIERRSAIREAAETFERLAAANERKSTWSTRGRLFSDRAQRYSEYARKMRRLEKDGGSA